MRDWRSYFRGSQARADFGADAAAVARAQSFLNQNGYASPPLATDGDPGPLTQAATKRFQASRGLQVDGVLGPATFKAMGIDYAPAKLQTVSGPAIAGLRQAVVNAFPDFSGRFEGKALPYPYTDSKGLVTTGTGNLMEPFATFAAQPWRHGVGGPFASPAEKQAGYDAVKGAWPGVQSVRSQSLTDLRLNPEDLNALLFRTLKSNHDYLSAHIPGYTDAPADAQLSVHSNAWAWGPGFVGVWGANGQDFLSAFARGDYLAAADALARANVHEESINPGIVPRNAAARALLANAAKVKGGSGSPDTLYWPGGVVGAIVKIQTGLVTSFFGLGLLALGGTAVYNKWKTGRWQL